MKYKVVMLSYLWDDIIIDYDLTLREAQELLKKCEKEDSIHYYEIKEDV
jgi:hypothetical protein